jgi:hypothetical protein
MSTKSGEKKRPVGFIIDTSPAGHHSQNHPANQDEEVRLFQAPLESTLRSIGKIVQIETFKGILPQSSPVSTPLATPRCMVSMGYQMQARTQVGSIGSSERCQDRAWLVDDSSNQPEVGHQEPKGMRVVQQTSSARHEQHLSPARAATRRPE